MRDGRGEVEAELETRLAARRAAGPRPRTCTGRSSTTIAAAARPWPAISMRRLEREARPRRTRARARTRKRCRRAGGRPARGRARRRAAPSLRRSRRPPRSRSGGPRRARARSGAFSRRRSRRRPLWPRPDRAEPERAREDARPPPGRAPNGTPPAPFSASLTTPSPPNDDDRVGPRRRELGRVTGRSVSTVSTVAGARERRLDLAQPCSLHARRERVRRSAARRHARDRKREGAGSRPPRHVATGRATRLSAAATRLGGDRRVVDPPAALRNGRVRVRVEVEAELDRLARRRSGSGIVDCAYDGALRGRGCRRSSTSRLRRSRAAPARSRTAAVDAAGGP